MWLYDIQQRQIVRKTFPMQFVYNTIVVQSVLLYYILLSLFSTVIYFYSLGAVFYGNVFSS